MLGHLVGRAHRERLNEQEAVPHHPAEEVVDGCVQGLADLVVEGHLDAGLGGVGPLEEAMHQGVDLADAKEIAALQRIRE